MLAAIHFLLLYFSLFVRKCWCAPCAGVRGQSCMGSRVWSQSPLSGYLGVLALYQVVCCLQCHASMFLSIIYLLKNYAALNLPVMPIKEASEETRVDHYVLHFT